MKLVIKGIDTAEDARLCREHGADAVVVSNHGGRATETLRSTIESLAEVVDAVGSQLPVLVDGGFRRGTDIYKALALGARAVGIGRPVHLRINGLRPGRRRAGSGYPARRIAADHATVRNPGHQGHHAGGGQK